MKIVQQWLNRLRDDGKPVSVAPAPLFLSLEPRVVYDASLVVAAAAPAAHATDADAHAAVSAAKPIAEVDTAARTNTGSDASGRTDAKVAAVAVPAVAAPADNHQVVFIDPSVPDSAALIAGLASGTQVVMLNASTDGFAQIAQYLQTHSGVESIHLISHGADGEIQAGSTWLNASDLSAESAQLAAIGAAMKPGGDFLIYGCDVAQNADGQALVRQVAALTNLNVAASTDATGASAQGGNWALEYQVGSVHTPVVETAAGQQQYDALLGVKVENYDQAAQDGFSAVGSSQFTLDGVVYTFDQPANTFAYNGDTSPVQPPSVLVDAPNDGVLEINPDGSSALSNVTISLGNGHTFNLSSFDLDSFNGDLYIQAHYANGTSSGLIQLASASVGGFTGTVSSQLGSAFNNIISFSLIDQNDSGSLVPTLDNLTYQDTGPTVTPSSGSSSWSSADNGAGTGGSAVAVDPGITLSDGGSSTAKTATLQITNFQTGDVLGFTAQNGISSFYDPTTGTLTLTTGAGTATIAQWQAALESVTFSSSLTSPNLSTTTRTVSFSFNDGTFVSNLATRNVTITAVDQTPVLSEGGAASTSYTGGQAAVAIDANLHVSDADNSTLSTATVAISSGFVTGDALAFSNTNSTLYGDIQASYNPSTHTLSLFSGSGTATVAQWQQAVDSVTFAASASTTAGTRDITFTVSDGTKTSSALHHSMVVSAPPLVTTDSGSASFVTGDNTPSTPVVIDAGILLSDGSSTTLASATIQITSNFQVNHDELLFTNNPATMGDISATYNTSTGLLTLSSASGLATLAQWQAAMRSVTYTSDLVVPSNATRTLTFRINDGTLISAPATRTITVTDTDQTPIVTASGGSTSYLAGAAATVVDSGMHVTDADGGPIASATVSIGSPGTGDTLAFTNNNATTFGNITGTFASGTLTLTSSSNTATLAQWQAALDAVTFSSSAGTSGGARTISFSASDGTKTSAIVTKTVSVSAVPIVTTDSGSAAFVTGDNAASTPVAVDPGLTVAENGGSTLASATVLISNGFQVGEDILQFVNNGVTMGDITATYDAVHGRLNLSSTSGTATLAQWQSALRSVAYTDTAITPDTTTRTISFSVNDGSNNGPTATRTVTVTDTDQTPIVNASGGSTSYVAGAAATTVDSGVTVSDLDNSSLATGTVVVSSGAVAGDTLAFNNTSSATFGNIAVASYNTTTHTLSLSSASGTATLAQWQAALEAVTFSSAVSSSGGARTISFSVSDGTKTSAASTQTVSVSAVPIVTTDSGSAAFVAGDNAASTPVVVDPGLTVAENGGSTLASATVLISNGFQVGEDVLQFTNDGLTMGDITATYDAVHGQLNLSSTSGTATLAQWQSALRSVAYTDVAVTPDPTTRAISFTVNDGSNAGPAATRTVTVTDTDQTPIVTTSSGATSYGAGSTARAIDSGLNVSDLDNTTLASATVTISSGAGSGDALAFSNTNPTTFGNITGTFVSGTLTLTSSGASATLAQWQAALDAVTFSSSATTTGGSRTVSFAINDGTKTSTVATKTVSVAAAPIVTTDSGSAAFVAGDNTASTPVAIDSGLTLADSGSSTLGSVRVQITGNFHAAEDVLAFTNDGVTMGNITGSYNAGSGLLTLTSSTSSATLAQWQAALRSVTYTDTAITPNAATRTISFTATDGNSTVGPVATRTVTVADTDQTPIATATSGSTAYTAGDTATAVDSGLNVSDLDNTTLASATVTISSGAGSGDALAFVNSNSTTFGNITGTFASGTLTLTSSGASATLAQWQAALDAVKFSSSSTTTPGARTISFSINDGTKTSAVATKAVDVAALPIVTLDSGSASFVAGDNAASTPVAVDSGLTLSDSNSGTLQSATVSLTGNFHAGEDVLAFTNDGATMGNITASYSASSGVLSLSSSGGTATLAQWQAALRSVTYTDTAITPANATRTVSFTIDDGSHTSATVTRTVTVTDTDQTPTLSTTGGTTSFVSGDNTASTPVVVDGGVSVADLDNATLASATVAITGNFHAGEDVLAFANNGVSMGNIGASYNASTGVLTLTSAGASATQAQWQAALRAVTYTDTAVTPASAGGRTMSFSVSDGSKTSAVGTKALVLTDTDQTPIVTTSGGGTSYLAGAAATVVDGGVALSDLDTAQFPGATVSITSGFHAGDTLALTGNPATMGDIAANYDGAGTLTLTSAGGATAAQWRAALDAVRFSSGLAAPIGDRAVSFAVSDGQKTSVAAVHVVQVASSAPVLVPTSGSAAFVAADNAVSTPVAVDSSLSLTDLVSPTLASARVAISGNFHAGEDLLAFTASGATGNIAGAYDASSGVLTLTSAGGTATIVQWQAALRAVTYTDTAITPAAATRTVSFTVNDGAQDSATVTRSVTVADTDQTPVVTASAGHTVFTTGDNTASTPVAVDAGLTLSDRDNATLASATVSLGGTPAASDVLAFHNDGATMGNIVASYDAGTGVLSLSSAGATATVAQWQAALRSVTYTSTAVTPSPASDRTVSFAVNDGTKTSAVGSKTLSYVVTDQTPLTGDVGGTTHYLAGASAAVIDSGVTVSDLDSATLPSATVSITGGLHSGDTLALARNAATMGDITASYDATTGTLSLGSVAGATSAQWQAALDAVTFSSGLGAPLGNRTISLTVSDGTKTSAVLTHVVEVDSSAPVLASSSGSASFVAADNTGSTPVVVDGGLVVSDPVATTLASATVTITGGLHAGEDVLAFANDGASMGNIAASYNASSGVLTLTSAGGTATLAQWQAALRAVSYADTAVTPATAVRTIAFKVNDGVQDSAAVTRTVTVSDTDQTPLLATSSGSSAFVAADNAASTPVVVDGAVTLSDADNTTLASARVAISGNFHAGEDVLALASNATTMGNITASYDAGTGVLSLSSAGATASVAQWQAALRAVTYTDTAVTPATDARTISFSVYDGSKSSLAGTRTVTVADTEQTPLLTNGNTGAVTFIASGNAAVPVAIAPAIGLSDRDSSSLASATVSIGTGFQSGRDVLAFTSSTSTGDIAASYDATTGVMQLTSASHAATIAQWQAALAAVTYADTTLETTGSSRTIVFSANDGSKSSQALSVQVTVARNDLVPPQPILAAPPPPQAAAPAPAAVSPAIGSESAGTVTLVTSESAPPVVLEALAPRVAIPAAQAVAGIRIAATGQLAVDRAPLAALTAPIESVPVPALSLPTFDLPHIDVHVEAATNGAISVALPALMSASDGALGTSGTAFELRQADGRPLPEWLHYDDATGLLSGKAPQGEPPLRLVVTVVDAQGRVIRREVSIDFDAKHAEVQAPNGAPHKPGHAGHGSRHAAAPAAKPSLDAQFARARQAMHGDRTTASVRTPGRRA